MSVRKAVQIQGPGDAKVVSDAPYPKLRDDYIIVKVKAVAVNPTDWQHIDFLVPKKGPIVGCDYSGVVEKVGKAVTNGLKPGDKVSGFVHGSNAVNYDDGAFADYVTAKGELQIKIPDNLSFEEAATLGVGITTVGQGLYQSLKLPLPSKPAAKKIPLLVYGGSTATGTLAIQFAKLSGLDVITTCSPHNFDLVKKLGADHAFDYNSADCSSSIRKAANNNLLHVFDCISTETSAKICAEAVSEGATYSTLKPVEKFPKENVTKAITIAYTVVGEMFKYGEHEVPAKPEDYTFGVEFWKLARELLAEGKVKPHPADVKEGGLGGVLEGIDLVRKGKVSGAKLVYKI